MRGNDRLLDRQLSRQLNRQLNRELCKDRGFVFLLLVLSAFTSFMYFFVQFSVDGNLQVLDGMETLAENQVLYRNGLVSNRILAGNVLLAFAGLTGFAFALYFYRFFRRNQVEMGCLKALGFTDRELGRYFTLFAAWTAVAGAVAGLAGGYSASDILLRAAVQSYQVDGLVKGLKAGSFLVGFLAAPVVAGVTGYLIYGMIRGKETGILMAGAQDEGHMKRMLRIAGQIASYMPEKHRLPVRLAIRKPVPVLLILCSSACFSIMFILAYSLNLSSGLIFKSQTEGHSYLYNTVFEMPVADRGKNDGRSGGEINGEVVYLREPCFIEQSGNEIEQTVIGLEGNSSLFELLGSDKEILPAPKGDEVVIGKALNELYGVKPGDRITVSVVPDGSGTESWIRTEGGTGTGTGSNSGTGKYTGKEAAAGIGVSSPIWKIQQEMTVTGIAWNAATDSIYMEKRTLENMCSLPAGAYNGIWSTAAPDLHGRDASDTVVIQSHEEKLDALRRDLVSNRTSAVINQVMGCFIGCILLYLALLLNFQDSARDIQILSLLGYDAGTIRKMLIDIYRPVLWLAFILTLWPGILAVKAILKSLSLQIGDYIPFQTNAIVILGIFLMQSLVYWLVQFSFQRAIRRTAPMTQLVE